jgi:hypothetical protein
MDDFLGEVDVGQSDAERLFLPETQARANHEEGNW